MNSTNVYFIYDGECPICTYAAQAFRIKLAIGELQLINAREGPAHPLILRVNQSGLDLDEGMVIIYQDNFYHGRDALHFMSLVGSDTGWFNKLNAFLFRSKALAYFCYPAMRMARNLLIRMKRVPLIDNLGIKSKPVFQSIFSETWHNLPPVMRKHYANHAYTDETITVEGRLKIESSAFGRLLFPLLRVLKVLIPREEENVKTAVRFITKKDSDMFYFDRHMEFADGSACHFRSSMKPVGGNEMIEFMSFGLGWRLAYSWDGEKVILAHRGYVLNTFGFLVPLPLTLLIGKGYAEETPINDNEFSMMTEIRHPIWGKIYGYSGRFHFIEKTPHEQ